MTRMREIARSGPATLVLAAWVVLGCSSGTIGSHADSGADDAGFEASPGDDGGDPDGDAAPDLGPDADGATGEDGGDTQGCQVDLDHDGSCASLDCDDQNPLAHPGMTEICGDGADNDCDGDTDEDCQTGRVYYVDQDSLGGPCDDNGPGTIDAPWCHVAKANATLTAGDTAYIRAGIYEETIQPQNSGSSDSRRVVYQAFNRETVTFTRSVYCVRLQSRSYVTLRDLRFVDCQRNLYLDACHHVEVIGCSFDNPSGPVTWAGSRIYNGSSFNRISGCTFSRYGNESGSEGAWDDNACVLDIGNDNIVDPSDHNLIEDSAFFHGGHHILGVYGNYNVVRRNTFHNEEWYPCHRPETGNLCGNRNIILNTSFPDANIRNVIEDNIIAFSGVPPDNINSTGLSLRTQYNIVRRNVFYLNDSAGLGLSADGGNGNNPSHNHVYHNVFFKNGYPLVDDWNPSKYGMILARWVDDAEHNSVVGVAIKNNIFSQNQLAGIYFYYVDPAQQFVSGNRIEPEDPLFADVSGNPGPFDFGVFDFRLAPGSPCIDGGEFLTVTTGAGQASVTLVVEDAGYFSDGNGVVPGDLIQLEGQKAVARIASIDYDTNTLTLETPLTWEPGTGVAQPYAGARPDPGAFEHRDD